MRLDSDSNLETRAAAGDVKAQVALGVSLLTGADPVKGMLLLQSAGTSGHQEAPSAYAHLAVFSAEKGQNAQAAKYLEKAYGLMGQDPDFTGDLTKSAKALRDSLGGEEPVTAQPEMQPEQQAPAQPEVAPVGQVAQTQPEPQKPQVSEPVLSSQSMFKENAPDPSMSVQSPPQAPESLTAAPSQPVSTSVPEAPESQPQPQQSAPEVSQEASPSAPVEAPQEAPQPATAPVPEAAESGAPESPQLPAVSEEFYTLVTTTPRDQQNNYEWFKKVEALIKSATFYNTDKVSTSGEMPYLAAEFDDPKGEYGEPLPFSELLLKAMSRSMGLVFFSHREGQQKAVFSLTFGDLASIDLHGEIHSHNFFTPREKKSDKSVKVDISTPGEEDFPALIRPAVKNYITQKLGIETPKVVMLKQGDETFFAFNAFPDTFQNPDEAKNRYGDILWFMPTRMNLRVFKSTSEVAKSFDQNGLVL